MRSSNEPPSIHLERLSRGSHSISVAGCELQGGDGGFAYVRDSIIELYAETDEGLEQVFTLEEPPLSDGRQIHGAPLELQIELNGGLCFEIDKDGRNATLTDACGRAVLTYTGLKAWDAAGRELDAHLKTTGNHFSIVVDDSEAEYPIVIDPLIGYLRARLAPADLSTGNSFGWSMALDGDTLAVSSVSFFAAGPRGAVYVYRHTGTKWMREAKLVSSVPQDDGFGGDLAILGDTIVVGAPFASDLGQTSGSIFVFARTGNQWSQQARILANDGTAHASFGGSVALELDRLVVGAPGDDDAGPYSGSAYILQRNLGSWSQTSKLLASNGSPYDQFGTSVGIDGNMIVVGAPFTSASVGAGYVFRESGGVWIQEALLNSPGPTAGFFATSVAASNGRIVFGEPGYIGHPGIAHLFRRFGGSWGPEAFLLPQDSVVDNNFGWDVGIRDNRVLVGAPYAPYLGAAYVFENSGTAWGQVAKLEPLTTSWLGYFGISVALDTSSICVGDCGDSQAGTQTGAAYVFELADAYSVYCTAKINSVGCAPSIAAQGAGSANAPQGLLISCSQARNNKSGLLLYSTGGRASLPFQGGTLCVSSPIHRAPAPNSGGTPAPANDCSGTFSIDMNSFARGSLGGQPIPELSVIGTVVQCQWWGRDQGFSPPNNSMLSDAVEYTIVQ